jgi:hypothetical protein
LHFGNRDRIKPVRCTKTHFRPIVSVGGRLEYPIDYAAVKVNVLVEGRTEAVDEGDRPYAGFAVTTGAAFAQAPFHLAQKNAQHGTLQGRITLQVIAQTLVSTPS